MLNDPNVIKVKTLFKMQEDFIADKLKFSANYEYFGNFASNDINISTGKNRTEEYCKNNPQTERYVDIGLINKDVIRDSMLKLMQLNPVRWQNSIYVLKRGIFNYIDPQTCVESYAGGIQKELKNFLSGNAKPNGQWSADLAGKILISTSFRSDGKWDYGQNYWKLRALSNVAKEICKINIADFRNTKEPAYRDDIINVMALKYPNTVKPKLLNMVLDMAPDLLQPSLFENYRWINKKSWIEKYINTK